MAPVCKNCLVELEEDMKVCPLCDLPVKDGIPPSDHKESGRSTQVNQEERSYMRHILAQVAATVLFSGIVATVIVDLAIHGRITWSLYPMAICLILLSYTALLAFWKTTITRYLLAGWAIATIMMVLMHLLFPDANWIAGLAIPLLFIANVVLGAMLIVVKAIKNRGLNLIAYSFVVTAVLCLGIDGTIAHYFVGRITFGWSIIVSACLLPVTAVLMFIFYRTRNNPTIRKIFHT